MVSFLHPWPPLLACGFVLLMIIARLVRRAFARPREFPPLPWLLAAVRELPLARRYRPELDFFAALGVVLLAGLLCGRPHFGADARKAVVLLLDSSLSMGSGRETTNFTAALRQAATILARLGDEDRVNLAICGTETRWAYPSAPLGLERAPVQRLLGSAAPSLGAGSLPAAITEALARLGRASERERVLYVISDFQAAGWQAAPLPPFPGVTVVPVPVAPPADDNVAVRIRDRALRATFVEEACEIALELENFAATPRAVELGWDLDGRRAARDTLQLPPRSVTVATRTFSFSAPGVTHGAAAIVCDDALAGDNRVFFAIETHARRRVGLVCSEPRVRELLAYALGGAARTPIEVVSIDEVALGALDAVIGVGAAREALGPARAMGIPCLLFAAAPSHVPESLAPALRLEHGAFALDTAFAGNSVRDIPGLAGVRIASRLAGAAYGEVRARFTDGQPAIVSLPQDDLTLAFFGLAGEDSDLLQRTEHSQAAAVLLGELARLVLGGHLPALCVGREASCSLPRQAYRFFTPAGEEVFPEAIPAGAWTRIALGAPTAPGHFTVRREERIFAALPVNPPPEESRPGVDTEALDRWRRAAAQRPPAAARDMTVPLLGALFAVACAWWCLAVTRRTHGDP